MANINPENYEIELENFVELCSDYVKIDNKDIFINSVKNIFDIMKKENKYLLKLKPELEKEIEKMKEEINKGEKNQKKEKKNLKKRGDLILSNESIEKNNFEEKIKNIKFKWSEDVKILFNILLEHICNTCDLIKEDISKEEKYQKFSRNYIFDLDTSLSGLNCILHIYPSFIYLLSQFNRTKNTTQMNFIKYLIREIFPLLNYYHYCVSWPEHVCHKEDLENNFTKEKKEVLRQYNTKANSFQSFFESFRNINIIASIIHSITYKRRNMDNEEINLINQCRKEILEEINIILKDIDKTQNDLNEFNFLLKNDELYPKNVIMFKSCIIVLYSMSEFINNSDIFNQFNPFEIADLIFNKDYSNIISSISHILKKMKIDEKNSIFHEMGIKYLNRLFKYIKINQQKKQEKKDKKEESDKKNNNIKEDINMNINEEDDEIIMEQEEDSSEQNIRSISRRSIENEEEEINEEEEYEEEEELNPENILEENNVEEEDLFSLMHSEENEEDEDSNEVLNNSENPLDLNNINMRIIQNENDNDLDGNSSINSSGRFIANENDYYNEDRNLNYNYNEENILFYEPYTEYNLESKSKIDFLNFYEEFIVFPFLVLRAKSKNNLIYFSRQKINIDIFSNIGKEIVNKSKSMFLYYYLFPFDLNYNKYFDFCLIGLKDKTIKAYYNEIEKILSEFLSMYSINNVQKIKEICKEISDKLKEDSSIYQINDKEKKDEIQKPEEKNKNNLDLDNKNDNDDSKEKNKEKEEESKPKPDNTNNNNDNIINMNNNEQNNNNDNLQFILELPQDLREEILRDLDPNIVPSLSPELRNEYNRVMNRNELFPLLPFNLNILLQLNQGHTQPLDKYYELRRLKYKKKNLLNILAEENNLNKNEEDILISTFDDEFLENMILYDVKDILIFKRKNKKKFNDYGSFMNILINNEILRYKILDILLNLWICDPSYLNNLIKEEKINQNNNSFLDKLNYIYIKLGLNEDYFLEDFEFFFTNFAIKHQKYCKTYFLQTFFNENGEYILDNKIYNITANSRQLKKLMNIEYKINENVLNNLINMTLVNNNSNLKTIFSLKIFTVMIHNCIKNKSGNDELNINKETIEKILDLFNNFEITLVLNKGQRSNNPTILIKELINDKNIFKIILEVLPQRFKLLKEKITKEMDDFLINKKIDINLFNKLLPDIVLFKLVKFISNINDYFNEENKNSENISEMNKELKHFIKSINEILFPCWKQLNNLLLDLNNLLKDSQEIIFYKLNRLIPYLETFITLSHLQFISTNSATLLNSENNPFIFEKNFENQGLGPIPKSPNNSLSLIRLNSKNEVDSFVEYFYEFCEKNKKIINFILRQYPKMFTNELIKKISSLLDLENKQKYFRHSLKKLPASRNHFHIQVRRNGSQLFSDSYEALNNRPAKDLRGKLIVNFENEEAVDAGGVKREWLTLLSKEMFNPNYMLFTLAKNGSTYTINSDSGKYNPDHLRYFEFIGKIMAKAIFDGMMIDCYFTRIIYKLIIGTPISYHDMEDYDPVYYNSIKWLLENDFTEEQTSLTYSYNHDNLGEIQTVDLIENGRNIEVTESNKFDYVQRLCSSKLYDTIKLQIDALLKGFYDIIPKNYISIFNYRELELVISGMPTIDITDWKNNTIYENYNEESNVIKNFWEIIESFDNDERAEFLQFVTGSSKVPLEGFCALQGIGGINRFKISKVFDKNFDRLPTAHTCTNQLDLPDYPTKEILNYRLRLAIKEGKNSFGFI